jgi:hypothetical protein
VTDAANDELLEARGAPGTIAHGSPKDVLLLVDVAAMFALPNARAALRFLRENSLPVVQLGRRLVVVRSALLSELHKRSRVEDRGPALAAVVHRIASGRRGRSPLSVVPHAPT